MKDFITAKERLCNPYCWKIFDECLLTISYLTLIIFIIAELTYAILP
jgi:hypothetical protein